MNKDLVILMFKWIRYRPLRSWLTILGIVLWIMLVVIITSLSSWIRQAIWQQMQRLWWNIAIIIPWKETNPLAGMVSWIKFKEQDIKELAKIPEVESVIPWDNGTLNVEYKWEKKAILVHAWRWKDTAKIFNNAKWVGLAEGAFPIRDDANEIIAGYTVFNKVFKDKLNVWDDIVISSKKFKVNWYFSEIWNQMDDNSIFMSIDKLRDFTWSRDKAQIAFLRLKPDTNMTLVSAKIKFELSKQSTVKDFTIMTPDKAESIVGDVLVTVELALVFIALVSLLVGWVWITNTMYMSVLERTKQIWTMKAIWASKEAILTLFLIESGIIWIVGWIIWIIIWMFIAFIAWMWAAQYWVKWLFSLESIDYLTIFVILVITFLTWVFSWYFPAKKAASLDAAEALRYE